MVYNKTTHFYGNKNIIIKKYIQINKALIIHSTKAMVISLSICISVPYFWSMASGWDWRNFASKKCKYIIQNDL